MHLCIICIARFRKLAPHSQVNSWEQVILIQAERGERKEREGRGREERGTGREGLGREEGRETDRDKENAKSFHTYVPICDL